MGLPQFSIKQPVTTVMIFLGVALFGLISLSKLPMELFPPIEYPQLTVFTVYANAAPEEVEALITKPIEEAVGTVSGLRSIKSISREGVSLVFAEFGWEQNMDFASLKMREKIDLMKARLPRDCSEPLVVPFNPFETPILTISVTGDRSPEQLRRIAVDIIKDEIEKVDGVASASVEGGLEREIIVDVNQDKVYTYGIPITDISEAITNSNLNYPAGTIKESFYEYLIRTLGEFKKVEELKEVVVKGDRGVNNEYENFDERLKERSIAKNPHIILLKDIAVVKDDFKERSSYSRYNGMENISVSVQKQAQTNTIQVVNNVKDSFKSMKKRLPPDVKLDVVYDQSTFIRDSILGVSDSAWQGGLLVLGVLLFFLKDFVSSMIVTLSIPLSIVVVFTLMYFSGLTLNMMSLGGLALGVGMLVDNGIVVIENIFQHRERGESPEKASAEATEEVSNAVTASTLTTIAVFLPMIFVVGIAGQLFKELAFTVTFSLIGSLWVSFTIIPLLSCKLSGVGKDPAKMMEKFEGGAGWKKVKDKYAILLEWFIKRKKKGLLVALGIFVGSIIFTNFLEKEVMPKADQGEFVVKIDLPIGARVEETNRVALLVEKVLSKDKNIHAVSTVVGSTRGDSTKDVIKSIGSHQAQVIVVLKEKGRKDKTVDIVQRFQNEFRSKKYLPAKIETFMQQGMMGGAVGGGAKPIVIEIKGENIKVMSRLAEEVTRGLEGVKGVFGVENDKPQASPEVRINIDKEKAALYNISVVDLAKTSQMVLRGYIPSQFKEKGKEFDIRVVMREKDRDNYSKMYQLLMNSPSRGLVPLGTVAKFEQGVGPSEIKRSRQERTITVAANAGNRKMTDIIEDVEKMIKGIKVESGYRIRLAGESEEMKKSFDSLRFALILSIVLVYMIMAAQFESIIQPLIILMTVPLSIIGVIFSLLFTGTSLSVVSMLGVIILGGVVVNNGIVLIDFANILMRSGKGYMEAIMSAAQSRLRPIVMTAMTTVLGLVPMAVMTGKGAELRAPMAISVMGGLTVSTLLTLLVIPAIFVLEQDMRKSLRGSTERIKNSKIIRSIASRVAKIKNRKSF